MLKSLGIKLAVMSVLLMIGVATAMADEKSLKGTISLSVPAEVNNTKLKPGRYDVEFNTETSEVTFLVSKKVIATVKANVTNGSEKPRRTEVYYSTTDKGAVLTKLVFQGDERVLGLRETTSVAGK